MLDSLPFAGVEVLAAHSLQPELKNLADKTHHPAVNSTTTLHDPPAHPAMVLEL